MPSKSYIDPLVKLTKEQWKAWFRRALDKEGKLTESLASRVMQQEPPVERIMGRLEQAIPTGGVGGQLSPGRFVGETTPRVTNLPIEEARAKYFANPEDYLNPTAVREPSAKVLEQFAPGEGSPAFARDVAYTRQKFAPIVPGGTQSALRMLRGEVEEAEVGGALRRIGLTPEDVHPGLPIKKFLTQKGVQLGEEGPPIADVLQTAMLADAMWKTMGGGRSAAAKQWEAYRSSSKLSSRISNARDYFISSFNRWRQDPKDFTKKFPREAKLLKSSWDTFSEALPEGE